MPAAILEYIWSVSALGAIAALIIVPWAPAKSNPPQPQSSLWRKWRQEWDSTACHLRPSGKQMKKAAILTTLESKDWLLMLKQENKTLITIFSSFYF